MLYIHCGYRNSQTLRALHSLLTTAFLVESEYSKMKSAVVHQQSDPSAHPCKIERLNLPQVQKNEILLKLHANGCCHTDLHAIAADWPTKPNFPLIPGHEGVGEVVVVS
jgi:D-arabinose 1-dehydrogenase-like Zn-dependent alcohol dehydrogenase